MDIIDACLVLGCNGHTDKDGFVYCAGVYNTILSLKNLNIEDYKSVVALLDNACGLFDQPMFNYNKCTNTISMLYRDYNVIDNDLLLKLQGFFKSHKQCGLYLLLLLREDL